MTNCYIKFCFQKFIYTYLQFYEYQHIVQYLLLLVSVFKLKVIHCAVSFIDMTCKLFLSIKNHLSLLLRYDYFKIDYTNKYMKSHSLKHNFGKV